MKMSPKLFTDLRTDCEAICAHGGATVDDVTTGSAAWDIFHKVARDRSYDDTHPGFTSGTWTRVLDCNRGRGEPFIDRFYRDEDLLDSHIATALRKIFPNAKVGR